MIYSKKKWYEMSHGFASSSRLLGRRNGRSASDQWILGFVDILWIVLPFLLVYKMVYVDGNKHNCLEVWVFHRGFAEHSNWRSTCNTVMMLHPLWPLCPRGHQAWTIWVLHCEAVSYSYCILILGDGLRW